MSTREALQEEESARGDPRRGSAGGPRWANPSSGRRVRRLRRRASPRGLGAAPRSVVAARDDLRGIHAVQLYEQSRPERDDVPDRGRGVPDASARARREVRGVLREDRRRSHPLPVPDSPAPDRHVAFSTGSSRPASWSGDHVALRHRDEGAEARDPDDGGPKRRPRRSRSEALRAGSTSSRPYAISNASSVGRKVPKARSNSAKRLP